MAPSESVAAADSATGFRWLESIGLGLVAFAIYLLLPEIAPPGVEGMTHVLLFGILLGLVVGLAARVDASHLPAIALGSGIGLVVQLANDGLPLLESALMGLILALEVGAVVVVLRLTGAAGLTVPADVFVLVAVATAAGLLAGLAGTGAQVLTGLAVDDPWGHVLSRWADDVFGLVCIAPALLTMHRPTRWNWDRYAEYSAVVAATAAATYYIFWVVTPGDQGLVGWPYIVLLGPMWVAVRFGVSAVAPIAAVMFWAAAVQTVGGAGAFAAASPSFLDRLVALQLFAIVMSGTLLLLGVLRDDRLRSLSRVTEAARLLREVIDGSDAQIFAKSYSDGVEPRGRYELVNETWARETGLPRDGSIGRTDTELFPPAVAQEFMEFDAEVLGTNAPMVVADTNEWRGGPLRHFSTAKFPLRDADGRAWGVGGISTDVTSMVHARERETRSAELLRAVFEQSPTPAVRIAMGEDRQMSVFDANAAMCTLIGAPHGAVENCDLIGHVHPDDVATAWDVITFALAHGGTRQVPKVRQRELRMRTEDGRSVWVLMSAAAVGDAGVEGGYELVAQFEDVTARREAEEALSAQAMRDAVTGLPNRRALHERMHSSLQRLRRHPGLVTVLFCDLDRFKDVNDSLGHHVGDQLLIEVADRLTAVLRPEDTIARLGGDEFVLLGEGFTDASDAVLMALRLQDRLSAPWVFNEQVFRPAMSIGIATTADPGMSVDELLRRADLAMYRAKEGGRNRVEVYERAVDEQIQHSVAVQHDLRLAIDTGGLILHYQPIVRLSDESVIAAEALVRMRSRDGGLIPPGHFVPQAEASGLVVAMGAWVIRQALADLRAWRDRGREITMSVNVSPAQLRDAGFASFLLDQARFAGIDPSWLSVEVTETALIHDPSRSGRELSALSKAGVGVALDDFGTGYSSLSWLTQFPVNVVKIDKSFTDEVGIDERKTAIVSALIQVSHELGFTVVAEGVETIDQRDRLVALGADHGQGYLFGRPVPLADPAWA